MRMQLLLVPCAEGLLGQRGMLCDSLRALPPRKPHSLQSTANGPAAPQHWAPMGSAHLCSMQQGGEMGML